MNYKQMIENSMVSQDTLDQASKVFLDFKKLFIEKQKQEMANRRTFQFFWRNLFVSEEKRKKEEGAYFAQITELIENDETLLEAHIARSAGQAFLRVLPDDAEKMVELEVLIYYMSICKGTLELCIKCAEKKIAEMK